MIKLDWQLTTDDNGKFQMVIPRRTLGEHRYKLTASFAGDSYYTSASGEVSFNVRTDYGIYSLNLTGTPVISSGDTDTITATLLRNNSPVSDVVLDYEIKHGSTTISTGTTSATDANGQATISYTGTGIGDVDIIVSMAGMSLQETYKIEDCFKVFSSTYTSQTNLNYTLPSTPFEVAFTLTRQTGVGYVRIGTNVNNCILIGQLGGDGTSGIGRMNNGSYSNLKTATTTPTINVPIDIKCRFDGSTYEYTIGDETITNADVGQALTTLVLVYCTNNNSIKNLRVKAL